jgi:hypothetical protein
LSQEAKEYIDNLAGGTFFLHKIQEAQALFEKITTSERESEEYDAKKNSRATKIDPSHRSFEVWLLTKPQQVRSIKQNRNSKHNHLMGRKDPCPGSAVIPS